MIQKPFGFQWLKDHISFSQVGEKKKKWRRGKKKRRKEDEEDRGHSLGL
jgi:hypothetical protein